MFRSKADVVYQSRPEFYTCFPTGGIGAELGVYRGGNAGDLLKIARPRRLHLIDPWEFWEHIYSFEGSVPSSQAYQEVVERFANDKRVQIHQALSWEVLESFPDGYLDWCYLDSSHFYQETLRELALLDRKLKSTGILAGHDYCPEFPGVINAVDELCKKKGWKMTFTTNGDNYPSFGLTRLM